MNSTIPSTSAEDAQQLQLAEVIRALFAGNTVGEILHLDSKYIEALYKLAYDQYTAGNMHEAETLFRGLCLYSHTEPRFWMGLGGARQALGDYGQAIEAYLMASLNGALKEPAPIFQVGLCELRRHNREAANNAFTGVLHLGDPADPIHKALHDKARALLSMTRQEQEQLS